MTTGKKFDQEKLRYDLLPTEPLKSVVRVLMLGSVKYGDDNWKSVPECKRRYYSAAMRHLTAWKEGEAIDPESGVSHLGHAMCCLIFLLWHEENNTPEFTGVPTAAAAIQSPSSREDSADPWGEVGDEEITEVASPKEPLPPLEKVFASSKEDIVEHVVSRFDSWIKNFYKPKS